MKKLFFFFAYYLCLLISISAQNPAQNNSLSAQGNFSQYLNKTLLKNSTNLNKDPVINSFNKEENTIGTRFLFNEWVDGDSIIDMHGNLINTTAFIFNFDKVTGGLLATQDKINNMLVTSNGVQSFKLKGMGKEYFFKHVSSIDSIHFFLTLVKSDAHYSLYKRFVTRYIAANFRNDGVIQTGNDYNEFKDENEYYVVDETTNTSQLLSLKPKSLKAIFDTQKEKTDSYFKNK